MTDDKTSEAITAVSDEEVEAGVRAVDALDHRAAKSMDDLTRMLVRAVLLAASRHRQPSSSPASERFKAMREALKRIKREVRQYAEARKNVDLGAYEACEFAFKTADAALNLVKEVQATADTKTEWIVCCGSGLAPNPSFDNEAAAIARYREEVAIPSYIGPGHRRHASVIKRTTITQSVEVQDV